MTIEKKETIAATMATLMASGPSTTTYSTYKALNDAVGAVHGYLAGKVQALAGEKAWAWAKDTATGKWRKATDAEIQACRDNAATKNHGTRTSKVLGDADRAALDAQVTALEAVNNPALAPLLADLRGKVIADDTARKGSLKDRLQAAVDKLGLDKAVEVLEKAVDLAADNAEAAADLAAENA